MRRGRTSFLALTMGVVAVLALGVTSASAHGRGGGKAAVSAALVADAADRLDMTAAALTTAITDAAVARIDEAVEDGDLDAEDADAAEERAAASLRYAHALSRTRVVAANIGKTTTQLNTAFRAARRAQLVARIDAALADGDIEQAEADELKADVAAARVAGYKPLGLALGSSLSAGSGSALGVGGGCGGRDGGTTSGTSLAFGRG